MEVVSLDRAADGSVSAAWRVANPNVVAYLISETSHKIYLDGILVGTIHDTEPLGVPASANADRTTPLKGGAAAGARALTEAIARGSAGYRVDSQITIRVYDEMLEKAVLTNSGTVAVTTK